jgi:hypothetical protein
MAEHADRTGAERVLSRSVVDISLDASNVRAVIDEALEELKARPHFGDTIRAATRAATGKGEPEKAAAMHNVEIAAGALKMAALAALTLSDGDVADALRDIIAGL